MKRDLWLTGVLLAAAAFALAGLWATPATVGDILLRPFEFFWGTEQNLSATLLEVSENGESIKAASRRLLQPFGVARLIKAFPGTQAGTPPLLPSASTATLPNPTNR